MKEIEPVIIIGAGPIGLAAAANLLDRGIQPLLLESGPRPAASFHSFQHVKLFTPWSYLIDPAMERLLKDAGKWIDHDTDKVPYAKEFLEEYLDPFVELDQVRPRILVSHKVTAITRDGYDKMKGGARNRAPFLIVVDTPVGPKRFKAKAVIDASGTWKTPNPLGASGVWADGEKDCKDHIQYGIPDIFGTEQERYANKRVLVVGSGHSAIGSVLNLVTLAKEYPDTQIAWAVRRANPRKLWGGGAADEIKERGALGTKVHDAVTSGDVALLTKFSITGVKENLEGIEIIDEQGLGQLLVDEIIVATGSRPDLDMLRELRLEFHLETEAVKALGPLIDPNLHSCGTVPPHGVEELAHTEENFYIVGMKSYGRAPTFLLMTGYEQVRSVCAELAGDYDAARKVELELPQTGLCSTDLAYSE